MYCCISTGPVVVWLAVGLPLRACASCSTLAWSTLISDTVVSLYDDLTVEPRSPPPQCRAVCGMRHRRPLCLLFNTRRLRCFYCT